MGNGGEITWESELESLNSSPGTDYKLGENLFFTVSRFLKIGNYDSSFVIW